MASFADILFGNNAKKIDKKISAISNNYSNKESEIKKQELSQYQINQLLGKASKPRINDRLEKSNKFQNNNNSVIKEGVILSKSFSAGPSSKNELNTIIPSKINNYKTLKNPKQEKLYNNLKSFTNINEIFEELEKNKEYDRIFVQAKEPTHESRTVANSRDESVLKYEKYKATSTAEANILNKIEEINKKQAAEEMKMLGKKQNKINSKDNSRDNSTTVRNISNINYTKDDIWCSKCKKIHHTDYHNKPLHVDLKKVFADVKKVPSNNNSESSKFKNGNKTSNSIENNKTASIKNNRNVINNNNQNQNQNQEVKTEYSNLSSNKLNQKYISNNNSNNYSNNNSNNNSNNSKNSIKYKNIPSIEDKISNIKNIINPNVNYNKHPSQSNSHKESLINNNNTIKKPIPTINSNNNRTLTKSRSDGAYYSREDFYEEDDFIVNDRDEDPQDYRRYLSKINSKLRRGGYEYDDKSDEDLEEAGFDEMQDEEEKTARIGEHEDYIEELREKKRKYH